jgi:predicted transcriptional regulator
VQVSQNDMVDKLMIPFEEIRPLIVDDEVGKVVMRFFQSDGIPVVDERGSCVGVVYAADCKEVDRHFSFPFP